VQNPSRARTQDGRRLDAELESTIYRIVQEALTNVSRHAEATERGRQDREREGAVVASVTDDGKGMPGADRLGPRGDGLEAASGWAACASAPSSSRRAGLRARATKGHHGAPGRATRGRPSPRTRPAAASGAGELSLNAGQR